MITPSQVLAYMKASQFLPFRVHMANGKVYEITRPDAATVGKDFLLVSVFETPEDEFPDYHTSLGLSHIESISLIRPPVDM